MNFPNYMSKYYVSHSVPQLFRFEVYKYFPKNIGLLVKYILYNIDNE